MAEYIEREALLKEIDDLKKSPWYNDDYGFGTKQARHDGVHCVVDLCIRQAPAADVVEVVRCRDCKCYEIHKPSVTMNCERDSRLIPMMPDDYCSYGERRSK